MVMRTTLLILSFFVLSAQAQIKPIQAQAEQIAEKYLMPINDTMDVIRVPYASVATFTMNVGQYSRIEPVPVNDENPTGMHFLPHRCLYDEDMTEIRPQLNNLAKRFLIITQKKLVMKEGQIEP